MPLSAALSCRDPLVSHTPILTERTCVIGSVRMRRPLSSASRTIGEFDKVVGSLQIEVDAGAAHRSMRCKSLTRKELQANLEYNMPPAVRASTGWRGPALLEFEQAFADIWEQLGPPLRHLRLEDPAPAGDVDVRVIATQPDTAGIFRLDQLIEAGNEGLLRAAEQFDWRQGRKFAPYAASWIHQSIQHELTRVSCTTRSA